ncbi:MAG: thioesterase family protein [Chloroflexota bacterium]
MTENPPFTVETAFPIRYAETDAMGIVHHASYIVYFEEGRSAYTRARGRSYAEMETDGYFLAVTEVQARYKKSMRYGQTVTVRCWLAELKSRTLKFAYELVDAESGEVCVTGETSHICLTKDGAVSRFPHDWLK